MVNHFFNKKNTNKTKRIFYLSKTTYSINKITYKLKLQ